MLSTYSTHILSLPFFPDRKLTNPRQPRSIWLNHSQYTELLQIIKEIYTQFCAKNLNEVIYILNIFYLRYYGTGYIPNRKIATKK